MLASFVGRAVPAVVFGVHGAPYADSRDIGRAVPAAMLGACSARIGLQADAAIPARTMVREFPVSPHGAAYAACNVGREKAKPHPAEAAGAAGSAALLPPYRAAP